MTHANGFTPSWRWLLALVPALIIAHELHELVHTVMARIICGAWGTRDFNVWALAPGCRTVVPTVMGPAFSWLVMWAGVPLLWRGGTAASPAGVRDVSPLGVALVFAPNPLGRLLPAMLGGGDEGGIARALVGPGATARLLVIAAAVLFVVPPLVMAWRALSRRRRAVWFLLLLFAGIIATGPLLLGAGNALLARGVLASPGPLGSPLLIDLVTVGALFWLFASWRTLVRPTASAPVTAARPGHPAVSGA